MYTKQDALVILDEAMERVKGVFGEALIMQKYYWSDRIGVTIMILIQNR